MQILFRLATADDLNTIIPMMRALQDDDPWSCAFDESVVRGTLRGLLQDCSLGRVWLICANHEPLGYIVMTFDYSLEYRGKGAWLDELFVKPAVRGKGIGSEALEFFENAAREQGVSVIYLEVNHGNPALELYRKLGFEDHQRYLMSKWLVNSA
jgi:diamine N-acetyltransferase